jgi:SAM-dependent methyltransferase
MDAKTLNFYDSQAATVAERYRAVAGGVSMGFEEAFSGFSKVLDVGCGAGRDLCLLLSQGHDAVGTDASREMLAAAGETFRQQGLEPAGRLVHDSLPDLASFADSAFDGVLCSAMLMHLPDERLFDSVHGLRRVLRPGGRLLLSVPSARPDIDPVNYKGHGLIHGSGDVLITPAPSGHLHEVFQNG